MHARAELQADVAGVVRQVSFEQSLGESAGAEAELEQRAGVFEVCMREKLADRAVLVDRLEVLDRADAVIGAACLLGGQIARLVHGVAHGAPLAVCAGARRSSAR